MNHHGLRLKCDVLLLADVFEKFRNDSFRTNGLCASRYLSKPAWSWDAMLNMTKVKLEFISDGEMYLFFKKLIEVKFLIFLRSQQQVSTMLRHKQESKHIIYLDVNNFYGFFQQVDSYGQVFRSLAGINVEAIDPKDYF